MTANKRRYRGVFPGFETIDDLADLAGFSASADLLKPRARDAPQLAPQFVEQSYGVSHNLHSMYFVMFCKL